MQAAKDAIPRGVTKEYKPHWNPDLQKAHDTLNKAREEAENSPGHENHINLQRCKAEYKRKTMTSKKQKEELERKNRKPEHGKRYKALEAHKSSQ